MPMVKYLRKIRLTSSKNIKNLYILSDHWNEPKTYVQRKTIWNVHYAVLL